MEPIDIELIKHREIAFAELHPDRAQAHTAALALTDVPGVIKAQPVSATLLHISYHVLEISLEQIESALTEAGFHLSSRLIWKMKRALFYYTEETQRANNGCTRGSRNCTQRIFINSYARHEHGCRDHRPEHWRRYL